MIGADKHFEDLERQIERGHKLLWLLIGCFTIGSIALSIAAVYVAWHFIAKIW